MLSQNFRPSIEGLDYFESELTDILINQLGMSNQQEYIVKSIEWCDWDDSPRWFVMVHIWGDKDGVWSKLRYSEFDVYGYENCGEVNIDRVERSGHGSPCISTQIADRVGDNFDWKINELEVIN